MRAILASTSANNVKRGIFSFDKSLLSKHRIWLIGIGTGIGVGIGAYYLWKKTRGGRTHNAFLVWAEQKKAQGIDVYKDKRYKEAIQIFNDIIQSLYDEPSKLIGQVYDELMAACENNIAACYDALLDSIKCIEHCTKAIQLKPDYAKALVRRARCLHRLERPLEALEDYLVSLSLEQGSMPSQQIAVIQNDVEKLMNEISEVECNKLLENRVGQRQKISQSVVEPWQFCTSIHDPLLLRAAGLHEKASEGSLDSALVELKRCNYDEIVSLSTKAIDNDQNDNIEKAQAVLLAARFLHYHGLEEEAVAMADKFKTFWEQLDEAQKLANKDLNVAQIVLEMTLERNQADESGIDNGNGENLTLNETKLQRLNQFVDEALRINPLNVDPLIFLVSTFLRTEQLEEATNAMEKAKQLDKDHKFIKYYETYINFVTALRSGNTADIHRHVLAMEKNFKDCDNPPVFALMMHVKIGILLQNNEIAVESIKKAIELMPNCSAAIYLSGVLEPPPSERMSQNNFEAYFQKMEKTMNNALEADPNNWEPYRMLAKMQLNKQNIHEAIKFYDKALELARGKDEIKILMKEKLFIEMEEKRRNNKKLPKRLATV
uniref:Uncharacterized protein n=1 Tax=Meloidogyne enterolobii TaxID=390850 RepID=A0A6V7YBT6_MELEN|nr:unnamed protein product [Meloidogyne enterolobii]